LVLSEVKFLNTSSEGLIVVLYGDAENKVKGKATKAQIIKAERTLMVVVLVGVIKNKIKILYRQMMKPISIFAAIL
jgi:hypothetical protein